MCGGEWNRIKGKGVERKRDNTKNDSKNNNEYVMRLWVCTQVRLYVKEHVHVSKTSFFGLITLPAECQCSLGPPAVITLSRTNWEILFRHSTI